MQAIATLVNDDPYLKLSPEERSAARKIRLAKIAANAKPEKPITVPVFIDLPKPVLQEESWEDRQRRLHGPLKAPWFYIVEETDSNHSTIEEIQRVVCAHYGVTFLRMVSARRDKRIILPRYVAVYLARQRTGRSLADIGRRFGGRDHTTMVHAIRKITHLLGIDPTLASDIEHIKAQL